jgi:L-histidine N-alpha-methyltransferase
VDISGDFLRESCETLAARYPEFPVIPVAADFTDPVELPLVIAHESKLGFFPGSTIGNLAPSEAVDLLRAMRETLGQGAKLLIGMDLIKKRAILEAAYDDAAGVTAQFNLNLAERINRELGGTIPVALRHAPGRNDPHREQPQVRPHQRRGSAARRRLGTAGGVHRRQGAVPRSAGQRGITHVRRLRRLPFGG